MTIKPRKNKSAIMSVGVSLFTTGLFVGSAMLKINITKLDIYLGAIWVFVLSLIIASSLSHIFVKSEDRPTQHH